MHGDRRLTRILRLWQWFLLLVSAAGSALAQDVSIVRTPHDADMSVRLEDLTTHVVYDRAGGTFFIIPPGRYSVQLLRAGRLVYQEVEYIGPDAPQTRTVDPSGSGIIVGMSGGNPQFDATVCSALEDASRIAVGNYGLPAAGIQRRLANADSEADRHRCATSESVEDLANNLAGSYGVTPMGMVLLSIEYTQLSPQGYPRHSANRNLDSTSARPPIWPAQHPGSNLTASLVDALKNGVSDVAVDVNGKPLLVCAAVDANTPLFCDSDGTVMAPLVNPHLAALYRLHVKTTPVDHHGVEEDHWTTFVGEDEYRATQRELASNIEKIQAELLGAIEQIEDEPSASPTAGVPGQITRTYATTELVSLIATTQKKIDRLLRDGTLQPLRREFPPAIAQLSNPSQPTVSASAAQRLFQELKDTVAVIAGVSGNLGVDLIFRTTPVETEGARLTFADCERCQPIVSQGGEHRFYRGRYYVTASLARHVPYEGWLDLVADPRTILECEMVRVHRSNSTHSSTCALRSQ